VVQTEVAEEDVEEARPCQISTSRTAWRLQELSRVSSLILPVVECLPDAQDRRESAVGQIEVVVEGVEEAQPW
jgi:hypothetical protein